MNPTAIFWPMVAHFALIAALYVLLGWRRRQTILSGQIPPDQWKLRSNGEPELSAVVSNNLLNQFELPILFYTVCVVLFVTSGVSWGMVILAWLFVGLRYLHSFEHITRNRPPLRGAIFGAGFLMVVLMWGWLVLHLADFA